MLRMVCRLWMYGLPVLMSQSPTQLTFRSQDLSVLKLKPKQAHLQHAPMSLLTEGPSRPCEMIVWKAALQIGWVWPPPICPSFHCFYETDRAAKRKGEWNPMVQIEQNSEINKYMHAKMKPGTNSLRIKQYIKRKLFWTDHSFEV